MGVIFLHIKCHNQNVGVVCIMKFRNKNVGANVYIFGYIFYYEMS